MKITLCFIVAFISVCFGYTIERKADYDLCQTVICPGGNRGKCYVKSGVPACKCVKGWTGSQCSRKAMFGDMEGVPNFPFKRLLDALLDEAEREVDSQEFYENEEY